MNFIKDLVPHLGYYRLSLENQKKKTPIIGSHLSTRHLKFIRNLLRRFISIPASSLECLKL